MRGNWKQAVKFVLLSEGGYTNHPNDPGGPTNFGIIQAEYSKWIGRAATISDMKEMKRETAEQIYLSKYWTRVRCDEVPSGLDYLLFDFGVNAGTKQAVKTLQRCLNVDPDGFIGPLTMSAIQTHAGPDLVELFTEAKRNFYVSISTTKPKLKVFLKGWFNRCDETRLRALAMLNRTDIPDPVVDSEPMAKAVEKEPGFWARVFRALF